MKRPKQHVIDTRARKKFQSVMPDEWVLREQNPDYAIDYDVEIFSQGQPVGVVFGAQLKGTTSPTYSGQDLIFSFETDKLVYYYDKVRRPVFIVVVDLNNDQVYWLFSQRYVKDTLEFANPRWRDQASVTLRFPSSQKLPDHIQALERSAREGLVYVFLLQFGVPHWTAAAKVEGILNDTEAMARMAKSYKTDLDDIRLRVAALKLHEGNAEQAQREVLNLFEQGLKEETADLALKAAAYFVQTIDETNFEGNRRAAALLDRALKLKIACSVPALCPLAKGLQASLEFFYTFERIVQLTILEEVARPQGRGTDALLGLFKVKEQQTYLIAANNLQEAISEALDVGAMDVACQLLVRLANTNLFAYPWARLRWGKEKTKEMIEAAAKDLDLARQIVRTLREPELECYVLQSEANLKSCNDDPTWRDTLDEMDRLAQEHRLYQFVHSAAALKAALATRQPLPVVPLDESQISELSDEDEVKLHRRLAEIAGVDLDHGTDDIARIARIGMQDRNPERILRFCEYLYVAIGSYGIVGELLVLPTAGSKYLYCEKVDVGLYGQSLDNLLKSLKADYCDKCAYRRSRPEEWKWTRGWQATQEEPKGLKKFKKRI